MVSRFFGYTNSYHVSDTLFPGRAYWIKVSQDGRLVLKADSVLAVPGVSGKALAARYSLGATSSTPMEKGLSRLSVQDALGQAQTLYFTQTRPKPFDEMSYVLPPSPPDGVFDVRYATQRSLEIADRVSQKEIPVVISSAAYPVMIGWSINYPEDQGSLLINGKSIEMKAEGQVQVSNPESQIRLLLPPGSMAQLPKAFLLHQNFPNPFNPTTTIRYDLPSEAYVTLRIYNALGQFVRTLVDENQDRGFKSAYWRSDNDAGNPVATGIYFYRLIVTAGASRGQTFTQVKRMVIVR